MGEDAVYRVLAWPAGQVSLDFGAVDHRCAIDTPTTGLLIEAMIRTDQAARKGGGDDLAVPAAVTSNDAGPLRAGPADMRRQRREWLLWAAGMTLALALLGAAISKKRAPGRSAALTAQGAPAGIMVVPLGARNAEPANTGASSRRKPIALAPRPSSPAAAPVRAAPPAVPMRPFKHETPPKTEARKVAAAPAGVPPSTRRQPNIQIIDDRAPQVRIVDEHEAHVDVLE